MSHSKNRMYDYNIFRYLNMKRQPIHLISESISFPLQAISTPQRIAILLTIGGGEACVCHLEAALGWRQAYISQHLMALRQAGILSDRREGRYIYYRLSDLRYLGLLGAAAALTDIPQEKVSELGALHVNPDCGCPNCIPAIISVDNLPVK